MPAAKLTALRRAKQVFGPQRIQFHIAVKNSDPVGIRCLPADIDGTGKPGIFRHLDYGAAEVPGDFAGVIGRSVIHHDHFREADGLGPNRVQQPRQQIRAVMHGNDRRDSLTRIHCKLRL